MPKRIAVCIGINYYKNSPESTLEFACDDAIAISSLLRDDSRGQFDDVIEIYNQDGNKNNIITTLRSVFLDPSRSQDDLILVYFSGHGIKDNGANLCLIPHDVEFLSDNTIDVFSTIHITDFQKLADNTHANTVILILDADRKSTRLNSSH